MIRNLAPFAAVVAILAAAGSAGVAVPAAQGCTSSITITSLTVPDAYQPGGTGPRYVSNSFLVRLEATSNCQIQTVAAEAFGRSTTLTYDSGTRWQGTVSVAGDPHGPFTLTGRVTDINGTSVTSTLELVHDTPAVVTVTSPTPSFVARPNVRITAACADDAPAGCVSFIVRAHGQTLLSGGTQYDQDVSLASFGEREVLLEFVGTDANGTREAVANRAAYIVANPSLVEVASVAEGRIADDSETHLLFFDPDTSGPLKRRSKSTGETETLLASFSHGSIARLFSRGAIFAVFGTISPVHEMRDGVVTQLDDDVRLESFFVNGRYAVWYRTGFPLVGGRRRDLEAGSTISAGTGYDVAGNGDLAYVRNRNIMSKPVWEVVRYRDGAETILVTSNQFNLSDVLTDGINVAYKFTESSSTRIIRLITPTENLALSTFPGGRSPVAKLDYAVAGGWTAFKRYSGPAGNIWLRSPAGEETQITFYGDDSAQIHVLNDDGRAILLRDGRMYLSQPGHPLRQLTLFAGDATRAFWRGSQVYVIVGASVFRLGLGPFTDDVLGPGSTAIRAVHITELRARIDAVRGHWGLGPYSYTDPGLAAGSLVVLEHFAELRTALSEAYSAAGRTLPTYTDPTLARGMTIRAVHLTELRAAVVALE